MKQLRKITGYIALIAVVFSLWVISGCSKSSSEPVPTMSIVELIASDAYKQTKNGDADKSLDSLVKYLALYPDLTALLGGTDKYTLFAPSNTAFVNLLATVGFPSNIKLINPSIIEGVLFYHIVAGQQLSSAFTSGASFNTLYGTAAVPDPYSGTVQKITINSDGTLKTGSTNQSIVITTPNQKATNGVVHVTATVLIPPSVGAVLTPILGTVAGTVLLGSSFSDLASIIAYADNGFTENPGSLSFKISTWLAMPITTGGTPTANASGITFFAVPNLVFASIAAQIGGGTTEADVVASFKSSTSAARGLLLNHLSVAKEYTRTGTNTFAANATITTLGPSNTITVTTGLTPSASTGPYGIVFANNSSTPSQAYLAQELVNSSAVTLNNGVIQVIGGVLK